MHTEAPPRTSAWHEVTWPPTLADTARAPRLPAFRVVRRARLVAQLAEAVAAAQLTVVCAPPGAGKTVLAAEWARSGSEPERVVWLTLGSADRFPGVFWWHVADVLTTKLGDAARLTRPIRRESAPPAVVDDLGASLLSCPQAVTLVLDGFEAVDHRVCGGVEALLRLTDDRFRLVLLTRRRPDVPLHRYRLEGRLAELGAADLRFTPKAVAAMLSAHGLRPSPAAAQTLLQRTEGWAAGIRLVALDLQARSAVSPTADEVSACLAPTGSLVGEYLQQEVVAELTMKERSLLRRCSVVETFSADLADWLVEGTGSEALLAELSRRHQLVRRVDEASGTYRMHPLLRAWFLEDLRTGWPPEAARLHLRAAELLARKGRASEAIEQAARSADPESATALLLRTGALAGALVEPNARTAVETLASELPDDVVTHGAATVRAVRAVLAADLVAAEHWLTEAADARGAKAGTGAAAGLTIAMVRARVALACGDTVSARSAAAEAEARLLDLPGTTPWLPSVAAGVRGVLGQIRLDDGDFDPAARILTVALLRCAERDVGAQRAQLLAVLALVEACRGNLTRAQELAETADGMGADTGVPVKERPVAGCLAQAWVAIDRQELARAQHWLGRAGRLVHADDDPALGSVALLLRVRMMRDRSDLAGARALLEPGLTSPAWVADELAAEAAALGLRPARPNDPELDSDACSPDDAARILVEAHDLPVQRVSLQVERYVHQAQRHIERGRSDAALALVARALELGEPQRIRRPFRHAGGRVRALIRTEPDVVRRSSWLAAVERTGTEAADEASPLPDRAPTRSAAVATAGIELPEQLTDREREVLHHLADLLNTQEIAAAMFISVNTVRTHVRHILDKLAVGRRNEAVRRARELGLV